MNQRAGIVSLEMCGFQINWRRTKHLGQPSQNVRFVFNWTFQSLTLVLSGKLTEWSDRKLTASLRASKCSSWNYGKWSYSAIQLEPNTWILEYKRSGIIQGPRFIPEICDFVRFKIMNYVKRLRREPWSLFVLGRV